MVEDDGDLVDKIFLTKGFKYFEILVLCRFDGRRKQTLTLLKR